MSIHYKYTEKQGENKKGGKPYRFTSFMLFSDAGYEKRFIMVRRFQLDPRRPSLEFQEFETTWGLLLTAERMIFIMLI